MRSFWCLLMSAVLLSLVPAGVATAAEAGAPPDYTTFNSQLSQPVYNDIVVEQLRVPMADGVEIHVEVTRPDSATYPDLKVPVIASASPYHGTINNRKGIGNLPDPRDEAGNQIGPAGYFSPRGYAYAAIDWRGTGHSGGCFDQLGQTDASDLKAVIEWLASQTWSNGRVGIIGLSMPGHAAAVAAAMEPEGLETAVIIAGSGSMYDSQFQMGVPFFAHFASPLYIYPALSIARYSPVGIPILTSGDDPSTQYEGAGCAFVEPSELAGPNMVTGQYVAWHAERDFNGQLANADLPLFLVHGVDDVQTRMSATEWFFRNRTGRPMDKVWLGPWGHTVGTRGAQWTSALHAWFDKHLQQRAVPTGPTIEAFFDTGNVLTDDAWTPAEGTAFYPDASDMSLKLDAPQQAANAAFTAQGNADPVKDDLQPFVSIVDDDAEVPGYDDGGIEFTSAPLTHDLVLFGLPELRLRASVTAELVHLVATAWRESPDGTRRLLNVCAIQPQLRNGVDTVTPVIPGEAMTLQPQCFSTAHHLRAGDQLVLRIGTGSHQHVPLASVDARITVFTGPDATAYTAPARPGATIHPDPLAPAEATLPTP